MKVIINDPKVTCQLRNINPGTVQFIRAVQTLLDAIALLAQRNALPGVEASKHGRAVQLVGKISALGLAVTSHPKWHTLVGRQTMELIGRAD